MRKVWGIYAVAIVLGVPCVAWGQGAGDAAASAFPLRAGNYWVYRGLTRWTDANSTHVSGKILTWKMEVLRTLGRDGCDGAVLRGHPSELAWYEPGKQRGEYLILRNDGGKFYLLNGLVKDSALAWLERRPGGALPKLEGWDMFLQLPLAAGESFGGIETGAGGTYRWQVSDVRHTKIRGIRGVDAGAPRTAYTLALVTGPDDTATEFVPGIGLTRYRYTHHGTVAETDLRLIEWSGH